MMPKCGADAQHDDRLRKMTVMENLLGPEPTLLPEDPAVAELNSGASGEDVAQRFPTSSAAWAAAAAQVRQDDAPAAVVRLRPGRLSRGSTPAAQRLERSRPDPWGSRTQSRVPAVSGTTQRRGPSGGEVRSPALRRVPRTHPRGGSPPAGPIVGPLPDKRTFVPLSAHRTPHQLPEDPNRTIG